LSIYRATGATEEAEQIDIAMREKISGIPAKTRGRGDLSKIKYLASSSGAAVVEAC
jgi:hypothetical protein